MRLSSSLLDAVEANSGYAADEVDYVVYTAIGYYMTSLMDLYDAAHTIVSYAHDHAHQGAYEGLVNASPALEAALFNSGLQYHGWINVQMSGSYEWTITLGNNTNWDPYDITFEIGSQGFNFDGSVAWPDSTIALGVVSGDTAITFDQYYTNYHSCSDGHSHGFRATINDGNGWIISYYAGQAGCGGSVMAGPAPAGAVPTRFAVRQAIRAPDGSPSALAGSPPALTLGAQIRAYGLTALDVDIPDGTALAPIEVTVYTPQGRVIRRFVTDRVGPGTQRVPWDRKSDGGHAAPAGVYVVVVRHASNRHRTHFVIPAEP